MAFMNQEKKAKIAAELKKVMPKDWKYSLAVKHHSSIVLTIMEAPIDLLAQVNARTEYKVTDYHQVNEYYLDRQFEGEALEILTKAKEALNIDNFDHSDIQTDYFCVGHWVHIQIGRWDKPFRVTAPTRELTYDELKARIAELERKSA